jgi:hypothetical protein
MQCFKDCANGIMIATIAAGQGIDIQDCHEVVVIGSSNGLSNSPKCWDVAVAQVSRDCTVFSFYSTLFYSLLFYSTLLYSTLFYSTPLASVSQFLAILRGVCRRNCFPKMEPQPIIQFNLPVIRMVCF